MQYIYVGVDEFTESGSIAPLRIDDNESHSLKSSIGARASCDLQAGKVMFRPEMRLSWEHEYLDREYTIDAQFASGAGSVFAVNSSRVGRDGMGFGAGVTVQWTSRVFTYLFYDTQFLRENYSAYFINGGVSIRF